MILLKVARSIPGTRDVDRYLIGIKISIRNFRSKYVGLVAVPRTQRVSQSAVCWIQKIRCKANNRSSSRIHRLIKAERNSQRGVSICISDDTIITITTDQWCPNSRRILSVDIELGLCRVIRLKIASNILGTTHTNAHRIFINTGIRNRVFSYKCPPIVLPLTKFTFTHLYRRKAARNIRIKSKDRDHRCVHGLIKGHCDGH